MEQEARVLLQYLNLYHRVVEGMKMYIAPAEQQEIMQGLIVKLFQHATSLYALSRGTQISNPPLEVYFWDVPSGYVLARAALETYATFHYIFTSAKDADDMNFRMCIHRIRGLRDRVKLPTTNPAILSKIASTKAQLDELEKQLKATSLYAKLNTKEQTDARKGKFGPSKTDMLRSALPNIGTGYAEAYYGFLSDYAHSGYVSMFQNIGADTAIQQKEHLKGAISFVQVPVLAMINDLINRYPEILGMDPTLRSEVRSLPAVFELLHPKGQASI